MTNSPAHRLLGVVLGGGRSSRMGRDKASLPHPGGGTFLQCAVDRLRAVCEEVVISTSPGRSLDCPDDVGCVVDPIAHQGPIIGVATCLQQARRHGFAACFCTPVDMPDLTIEELRRLRDAWILSPDRLVVAFDEFSGHLEPLVAIYPTLVAETLEKAASSDDRSLFRWIERQSPMRVSLPTHARRNVNTPDDLQLARSVASAVGERNGILEAELQLLRSPHTVDVVALSGLLPFLENAGLLK